MPMWLTTILSATLVIGTVVVARLVQTALRRGGAPSAKARIVLADYDRLVVAYSQSTDGDTVCVLRPPGEDPKAILRAARVVLSEDAYRELARRLSVPGSWLTDSTRRQPSGPGHAHRPGARLA
jgi:hypothetical protein